MILNPTANRIDILGLPVSKVDMAGTLKQVQQFIKEKGSYQIVTLNSEIAMLAQEDPELKEVICRAELVIPDGAGIVWASRMLGDSLAERVAGFDLMQELLVLAEMYKWPVFFLGAEPGIAEKAVETVKGRLPNLIVAGIHHGYFEENEEESIIDLIKSQNTRLLFVGMGAPKQDFWIARHKKNIQDAVCIGVGGSFNVLAGTMRRAPDWMGKCGLEWLFRLLCEPTRFIRMLALPKFAFKILEEKIFH